MEAVSIREYARRKGCSDTAIHKLIKSGVITSSALTSNPNNGRPMILVDQADSNIAVNAGSSSKILNAARPPKEPTPSPSPNPTNSSQPPKLSKKKGQQRIELPDDNTPPPPPHKYNSGTLPDGSKTKTELDRLLAEVRLQKAAIELRERKGQLVEKDVVYKALYELGQELRKDIMSIPDKTLDNIRASRSRQDALSIFNAALVDALTAISSIKPGDINLTRRK